jgi:guanosine-3',5'-bis(diphosphate) 3'-pyrophosphohydrolase
VTYDVALLLKAARFSAEKHRSQRRKGGDALPYINHPIEVAYLLANVGGITDLKTLVAAVLHDTVEDTGATFEELEALFGQEVRALVAELTDDKKLPKAERKRLQIEHASRMSAGAKAIKIADKICNVRDVAHNPPAGWSVEARRQYLQWAQKVVAGCRGSNSGLEQRFDEVAQEGWSKLGREP